MATALVETRFADTALAAIRDKVLAGQRLSFEDGVALYQSHDLLGHRPPRQPRARAAPRRRRLLRLEHAHQPHERLRRHLRLLRLRRQEGRAARLHDGPATRSSRTWPRCPKPVREVHIVGGLHPDLPWSYFTDMMRGIKQVAARHPHQGLHRGRDLLLPPPLPDERRAGAGRAEGGRPRLDAGRRGRDLRQGDARQDHPGQGRRRRSGWT